MSDAHTVQADRTPPAPMPDQQVLDQPAIDRGMAALGQTDAIFADALRRYGRPAPRIRPRGYETLLHAIVGQQVSTAAAASIWRKLQDQVGDLHDPERILRASSDQLRAAGLSRSKADYAHSLAAHVANGTLRLDSLPDDDEEAIRLLSSVRGLGRWSAEIYLLFAEGRADIFPAGDLAIRVQAGRMFLNGERPTEKPCRALAGPWAPWRGVAALFLWHCYNAPPL